MQPQQHSVDLIFNHIQGNLISENQVPAKGFDPASQALFSISWVINHVTCYKFDSSHWFPVRITAFTLERIFQPIRALEFITGHMVCNPAYTFKS